MLERLPGEYRVRAATASDMAWEAFETLEETVARGDELARALPSLPLPAGGKRQRALRGPKAKIWRTIDECTQDYCAGSD